MNIAIGSDHRGFEHKVFIIKQLQRLSHEVINWVDVGAYDTTPADYPFFAEQVCKLMQSGKVDKGILICASGVGMAITANRFSGIYAAVAWNATIAHLSVEHDNVNCLVLPSDFVSCDQALGIIEAWVTATFLGDRYQRRLAAIDKLGGVIAADAIEPIL